MPPRTPLELLRDRLPYNTRAEIIGGVLVVRPPSTARQSRVASRLWSQLDTELGGGLYDGSMPGEWLFVQRVGVCLPRHLVHESEEVEYLVPDIAGWRSSRAPDELGVGLFVEVPDLVCDVLDARPTLGDLGKRDVYAAMGVPAYWLVHARERWVEVCELVASGVYRCERHHYQPKLSVVPFGGELNLRAIFEAGREQ